MLMCKLEDDFIGRVWRENLTQGRHAVAELVEQIAQILGHIMVEQEFHSMAGAICRATSRSILFGLNAAILKPPLPDG
jgi:hypothetical protein